MSTFDPRPTLRNAFRLTKFDYSTRGRMNGRAEKCLQLLYGKQPTGKILNVGSSHGWLEDMTSHETSFQVVGVEFDETNFERAKASVPNAEIHRGSVLDLPFPDNTFDGATMFEVIEHIPPHSEPRAMAEIYRTLKPGAWFLLSTPFETIPSKLLDPLWYFGHRHYSVPSMAALMSGAGFRVEETFVRGGVWDEITVILFFLFKFGLDSESPFYQFFEGKRREEFLGAGDKHQRSDLFVIASKPGA
jgi:SAM-dependent methyltransferase